MPTYYIFGERGLGNKQENFFLTCSGICEQCGLDFERMNNSKTLPEPPLSSGSQKVHGSLKEGKTLQDTGRCFVADPEL